MLDVWDEIPVFVAVAKYLNFSKAAKELYYSQPYVSKQVRNLETKIGVKLFKRTTTAVELTKAGEALYDKCLEVEGVMEIAVQEARRIGAGDSQPRALRVLVKPFCESLASAAAERFVENYPLQRLITVNESWEGSVDEGPYDIELEYITDNSELRGATALYRDIECVHISNEAAEKAPHPISIKDLRLYTLVVLDKIPQQMQWAFAAQAKIPDMRIVTTDFLYGYLDTLERSLYNVTIWTSYIKPATLPNRTVIPIKEAPVGVCALKAFGEDGDEQIRKAIERFTAIAIDQGRRIQETIEPNMIGAERS